MGREAPCVRLGTPSSTLRRTNKRAGRKPPPGYADRVAATFEGGPTTTTYQVTLRDRETQTVVGYYNGSWTTDRRRALTLRKRDAAEAHAAQMRDRCLRNADLIKVEEVAAAG